VFFGPNGDQFNQGYVLLQRRNVEGGPRISDLRHTNFRGVLGTRGDISNAFAYDTYFQYGRTNYTQVYQNEFSVSRLIQALDVVDDPRTPGVVDPICRSVLTGNLSCVPYNVFGEPSQAAVNFLNVFGVIQGHTAETVGNFNVTGSLADYGIATPWAPTGAGINVGVEYRREALELNPDQSFQTGDLAGQGAPTLPVNGQFRVLEAFGELAFPLVTRSFIEDLTLGAGYRKSFYKLSNGREFDTDTYKLSLEFAPVRDLRFRGAYNRAVRAPNIQELFAPQFVGLSGTEDPCADIVVTATDFGCRATGLAVGASTPGNPAGQYNGLLGGNPNLNPEKATTQTLGVVIQPSFLPRFALTADYFNINVDGAIQSFGADAVIADCVGNATATFTPASCALINRDPGGSLFLTSAGFITDTPNNVGGLKTTGFDFSSNYRHPLGALGTASASFVGTLLRKYETDNGLSETYDCVGYYGSTCSGAGVSSSAPIPRWRHKLRGTLEMPIGIGLSLQWRHVGKVRSEAFSEDEVLNAPFRYDPGARIKAQNYFDLASTFTVGDNYNLRMGVNNIFDRNPPLVTSGNANRSGSNLCPSGPCNGNTFPGTWDALGRFFYVGTTLDF
jgi:outer membrane receptor protein involved in Fe transport